MAEPLKGILVGLGSRGGHWYNAVTRHPDTEWVAYVEVSPDQRAKAQEQWSLPRERVFGSVEEAISVGGADFVLDVTPPNVHEAVADAAFDAGLHLIGEKPMSDDFEAARRMVERGRAAGVRHMITQNYRFGTQPRTTRKLVSEGVIGDPGHVDVMFTMPWADFPGSHYVTQPYMFTKDMGIHHFDMLRYVLGREPRWVQCVTWNPSWGWHAGDACHMATLDFDGCMAVHRGVGCAVGTHTSWNGEWRIEGPGGTITWEGDEIWLTHLHRAPKRRRERIFPEGGGGQGDPLLTEFVAAIREGREPECSAVDNIRSLAMVAAAVQSAEEGGRRVSLDEFLAL
jgi:predicted dehydrogenase